MFRQLPVIPLLLLLLLLSVTTPALIVAAESSSSVSFFSGLPTISSFDGCDFNRCRAGDLLTIYGENFDFPLRVYIVVLSDAGHWSSQDCTNNYIERVSLDCILPVGEPWWFNQFFWVNITTAAGSVWANSSLYWTSSNSPSSSTGGSTGSPGFSSSSSSLVLPVIYSASGCPNNRCTSGNQIIITDANLSPLYRVEISVFVSGMNSQNCSVTSHLSDLVYCNLPIGKFLFPTASSIINSNLVAQQSLFELFQYYYQQF